MSEPKTTIMLQRKLGQKWHDWDWINGAKHLSEEGQIEFLRAWMEQRAKGGDKNTYRVVKIVKSIVVV